MYQTQRILILIVLGFTCTLWPQKHIAKTVSFKVPVYVLSSGSELGVHNSHYKISSTVGQVAVTPYENSLYLYSGFWSPLTPIDDSNPFKNDFIPKHFNLKQNFPNPFNPVTTIKYTVPEVSNVRITVYNISGQKISELVNLKQLPGEYSVRWSGFNYNGTKQTSGVYFYSIKAITEEGTEFVSTRKMVLVK